MGTELERICFGENERKVLNRESLNFEGKIEVVANLLRYYLGEEMSIIQKFAPST